MLTPVYRAVFGSTVLIRTNIIDVLYIQRRPIIVHRNAVPEKQTLWIWNCDTEQNKPYRMQSIIQ
jgi:hypothetical protein